MIHLINRLISLILLLLILGSCEIEETEYRSVLDHRSFDGFRQGYYILHNQSISYYSPVDHKVFPGLYEHQNGIPTSKGIHSLYNGYYGLITYKTDNKIEFMDGANLLSAGFCEIENPGNILFDNGRYFLVAFGNGGNEGIAMVDVVDRNIANTFYIGKNVSKLYEMDNYIYVFGDGTGMNDSIVTKYEYQEKLSSFMLELESFSIGVRPIDFVEIPIHYDNYSHNGLAILCKGNMTIPASIVTFDLIREKVITSYSFESTEIEPENLFWYPKYKSWQSGDPANTRVLASYVNNKLYSLKLNNPVEMSVLIDRNIDFLVPSDNYCLAVSRETTGSESYLYRFDLVTFDLVDSVSIPPKAFKLVGRGY